MTRAPGVAPVIVMVMLRPGSGGCGEAVTRAAS
jgi:hypothetical protein